MTSFKPDTCVTIVPYFDVPDSNLEQVKGMLPSFVESTSKEAGNLHYAFSFKGNVCHCREGYDSADALLTHLGNVDARLKELLGLSALTRLEVHGPAAEIDKLRGPLAGLNPEWYVLVEGGIRRT